MGKWSVFLFISHSQQNIIHECLLPLVINISLIGMHSSRGLGGGGREACTKFMTESVDSWAAAPSAESMDSWAAAPSAESMDSCAVAPSTESMAPGLLLLRLNQWTPGLLLI